MIQEQNYTLLFQCKDKPGIIANISGLILKNKGNIIAADQHTTGPQGGDFFMRVEFVSSAEKERLGLELKALAGEFNAGYSLYDSGDILRMGIMAGKSGHCLIDLLYLWRSGELKVKIPFVISNCPAHRELVEQFKVPFYFIGADKRDSKEDEILKLAKGNSDFLVLARYMLILSNKFIDSYGADIINIHHGFLPSFKGAQAYRQALERGVKVIGATAHFVNENLDDGPIIAQSVERVSHRDNLESLMRKGKNLEKGALAAAVSAYAEHRVIRHKNTAIVF
jgi:formyltetrahydrofolate deformylase